MAVGAGGLGRVVRRVDAGEPAEQGEGLGARAEGWGTVGGVVRTFGGGGRGNLFHRQKMGGMFVVYGCMYVL